MIAMAFLMIASSCQAMQFSADEFPWVKSGDVLYQTTFGLDEAGLERSTNAYETKGPSSEGYLILVKPAEARAWSLVPKNYSNTTINVDLQYLEGAGDALAGIICRFTDRDNFYAFVVTRSGLAAILLNANGKLTELAATTIPEIALSSSFELEAFCSVNELALTYEGTTLITIQDETHSRGNAGLLLQTGITPQASVLFKELTITKP